MSTDSDQPLSDRFARLAPPADAGDWADVLGRARRLAGPIGRRAPRRALLVAALVLALPAAAFAGLALSGVGTGVPAIDRLLDRANGDFKDAPPGAPVPRFQPRPGSVSKPLRFRFGRMHYTSVGFRAHDGTVCSALVDPRAVRASGGIGCVGVRSLRSGLRTEPLFLSGGGGGRIQVAHGFARADVVALTLLGAGHHGVVALSEPWKPGIDNGTQVRFFYIATDLRAQRPRMPLLPEGMRIEAWLADGSVTELRR
jgi:hypothetical protein